MSVETELYVLTEQEARDGIMVRDIALRRLPNGSWSVSGQILVNHALPDGRRVWGVRPLSISSLSQEGRKQKQEG